MAQKENSQLMRYFAMVCAATISISAALCWGSVATESVIGIQGDGIITMIIGIIALFCLAMRCVPLYVSILIGLVALGVSGWDYFSVSKVMQEINGSVGIGLYLTMAASFLLVVSSFIQWRRGRA